MKVLIVYNLITNRVVLSLFGEIEDGFVIVMRDNEDYIYVEYDDDHYLEVDGDLYLNPKAMEYH